MNKKQWIVYLIRCSDESLYCGITNNLKNRLATHNSGRGAKYTKSRRPVELVGASSEMTKSDALKLEYRIKQVSAGKKIFELSKEKTVMSKSISKELQRVSKSLKAIAKTIENLIKPIENIEKSGSTPKRKSAKKKAATKVVKARTVKKMTASDQVLGVIRRSKKGVGMAALKTKTGFEDKKIQNIVFKLKKQGKIKSPERGVYVKA
ncbi:GIY-YIG nuclease family protein [Thermodesulfobacteriota bacterium]